VYNIKDLFRQLSEGKEDAFTDIFYYFNRRLYPFALKKLKDPAIAEELVQDIFLKIWLKRENMHIENPEGYVYRMAANAILDHFKKKAYEFRLLKNLQEKTGATENTTEASLELKHIKKVVTAAIDELPDQRRKVYLLREEGLNYQEIGDQLGISPNTVKVQLVSANKFIRAYLIQRGISPVLLILFYHWC
jgi:RNA polymerase sigma-70 factor (family 1)